jgi:hypothetical protein
MWGYSFKPGLLELAMYFCTSNVCYFFCILLRVEIYIISVVIVDGYGYKLVSCELIHSLFIADSIVNLYNIYVVVFNKL